MRFQTTPLCPLTHSRSFLERSVPLRNITQLGANSNSVDRMLAKKLEIVKGATKVLAHAKGVRDNFERELSRAATISSASLSVCGKCHLKVGHTRRNCHGDDCSSIMLCGIFDKHPSDKVTKRNLSQQVTKCEAELVNLQME